MLYYLYLCSILTFLKYIQEKDSHMSNTKPKTTPFSFKRFITSSLAYFVIFSGFIGMFYYSDSQMLDYNVLFTASAIVALVLGVYHAKYKNKSDVDVAVDADVEHVEEEVEHAEEEIEEKLHIK